MISRKTRRRSNRNVKQKQEKQNHKPKNGKDTLLKSKRNSLCVAYSFLLSKVTSKNRTKKVNEIQKSSSNEAKQNCRFLLLFLSLYMEIGKAETTTMKGQRRIKMKIPESRTHI